LNQRAHPCRSNPLQQFKAGDLITAHVIGVHDAKTHRYLAITQANRTRSVLELTLRVGDKAKAQTHIKTLEDVKVGQQCTGTYGGVFVLGRGGGFLTFITLACQYCPE
jgi:rRNA biogenesis protein RRP5